MRIVRTVRCHWRGIWSGPGLLAATELTQGFHQHTPKPAPGGEGTRQGTPGPESHC